MALTVMDPTQEPEQSDTEGLPTAPRLDTLAGKTIGLWNNAKLNAAELLEMVRAELGKDVSFEVIRGVYDPSKLMPDDAWGEVDKCDAVIMANGDCGACSTSGIVNAIELEKRGIPALLISTEPFTEAVRTSAELRGMPAIRWAIVEHPIASLKSADLHRRAVDAAAQLPALMLAGEAR